MSGSRLRAESDAARRCERCGQREAVASVVAVASIDGVPSPAVTRQVCSECATALLHVPVDFPAYFTLQTHPAPRGVLAKVRWAWRRWRFARAVRRRQDSRRPRPVV